MAHLPELILALLARAARRLGRAHGVRMHGQREVTAHVPNLARVHVVALHFFENSHVEALAERALVVGELDDRDGRIAAPESGQCAHTDLHALVGPHRGGDPGDERRRQALEKLADLAQLVDDRVRLRPRHRLLGARER